MADDTESEISVFKLKDAKDYPLWCNRTLNELRQHQCENAILDDFEAPNRDLAIGLLLADGWTDTTPRDIAEKVQSERKLYHKARAAVGIIHKRVHTTHLDLLHDASTAHEINPDGSCELVCG